MSIEVRRSGSRFHTVAEGRSTWHSYSFGAHYDPANLGFGELLAHNDEQLGSRGGYPDHPHADTEIVTVVLEGALRHTSRLGSTVLGPGGVQRLSAGSGITHAEVADGEPTRFLQTWVRPRESGVAPSYQAGSVGDAAGWTCLAGQGGVLDLNAGPRLLLAREGNLELPDAARLHVFVADGEAQLGERVLTDGDAARLRDEGGRRIVCAGTVLVWAL